ncbi:nucleoid occlusion protein [Lactobacillus iners]|uniref:nucleoid occlusion protein n=1 Tax=Lactobacillus iners TaxID=147802 RepID=UPI001F09D8D5|nr:nucleoid occlusion protein [Lactobacillus iners]MCT7785775.1 nucleoid occlusion protein [Lactobacillus iners]
MSLFFSHKDKLPENKKITDIDLDNIVPNRYQPRQAFNDETIAQLAQTIQEQGLLQPIVVRHILDSDKYEIIAGERRYRAVKLLKWATIPAIVNSMADEQVASLALIENLQRENLNPIDEAKAYAQLMKINNLTQEQLAHQVGRTQSYIANKIRLLKLTPKVQSFLVAQKITPRHGRALLTLSASDQDRAVSEIVKKDLTVKETENMAQDIDRYFSNMGQEGATKAKASRKVTVKTGSDFTVQINTIKHAIKMVKDSGMIVKQHENKSKDSYKITIEILKGE